MRIEQSQSFLDKILINGMFSKMSKPILDNVI